MTKPDMATEIDWSGCSIVERDPLKMGGVPTVRALRLAANTIVENYDYNVSAEEIAELYDLPIKDVSTILAYAKQARQSAHSL